MRKVAAKVLLTNSQRKKPGPQDVPAGNIYTFAHQAYWGFLFLSKERKRIWGELLAAQDVKHIQEIGRACSQSRAMKGAGYGAAGLMTWLKDQKVARQVLAAKHHRRYPRSERPSSQDKRMIFLGIAVAAGVFGNEFSTALRKLAQAGIGENYLSRKLHNWDRVEEIMKRKASVWAEPVENYMWSAGDGSWVELEKLPCSIPENFQGGFILHGYAPDGQLKSTFSRTLPAELREQLDGKDTNKKPHSREAKGVK
jgi:hypothetical protein